MVTQRKFILVCLLMIGILLPDLRHAEAKLSCLGGDYYPFIGSIQSDSTKRKYFSDLWTLSYCQTNDILELHEELDAVRDSFRTAAINCESTGTYKEKYVEILMEMDFIRGVQKRDPGVMKEDDAEIIDANKARLLEVLHDEMYTTFVTTEGLVSSGTFESYFNSWSYEYNDRIGQYVRCDEGAAAELTKTLTDFRDTLKEIKEGWHIKPSDTTPLWQKLYSPIDEKIVKPIGEKIVTPIKNKLAAWKEAREQAKLEKARKLGADNSFENAKEEYNFEAALNALTDSELERSIDEEAEDRMSIYRALYGEGGSLAAADMQGILQDINEVIEGSNTNELPAIKTAVASIEAKQCAE